MNKLALTADEFNALIKKRMQRDAKKAVAAARDACLRAETRAVQVTDEKDVLDTGFYKWSWTSDGTIDGAFFENTAPYAGTIEHGRRPGLPGPPYQPILEWTQRKLVGNGLVEPEEAEEVARRIRDHIHHHGTEPKHVFGEVVPDLGDWFMEAFRRLRRKK